MKVLLSRYIDRSREYFYNSIKNKLDKNEIVYIIVPEQFTLGTEIEAFENLCINSTNNLKIKSFKTIYNEIINETGGRALNFITDSAKYIMIQSILLDIYKDLKIFQRNINDKEFIDLLIEFTDELDSNMITIEKLKEIKEKESISNDLKKKLSDLILILIEYNKKKINSNFYLKDRKDLAIENISKMESFKNINFYFYRFHDMSRQEILTLSHIDRISKFTLINLTYDINLIKEDKNKIKDNEIFNTTKSFLNSLRNNKLIKDLEYIEIDESSSDNEKEKFLNNLFTYDLRSVKKKFKDDKLESIKISRLNTTKQEVEDMAISIKKDIINKNYNYKDIAILTTKSDEYFSYIKKVFKINNIPVFIDEKRNLLDISMVKFIKSGLDLIISKLSTQSVIQFMNQGFLLDRSYEINLFNSFIQRRKIFGSMFFEDKYFNISNLQKDYVEEDKKNIEIIKDIRDLLLEYIKGFGNVEGLFNLDKRSSYKEYTKKIYSFFNNPLLKSTYTEFEDTLNKEQKEENRQVLENFIELLDDLYLINEEENISIYRYIEILNSAIDNFNIGIIPPSQDQVIVGDIKRSRFNKSKKIYVLGMTNLFYLIQNTDVDIFINEEKNEMINEGIEIKSTTENIYYNDLLSFYELLYTFSEEISFSYSLINNSNEAMNKAFIVEWIEAMSKYPIKDNISYKDYIYSRYILNKYIPKKIYEIRNKESIDNEEIDFVLTLNELVKDNKNFENLNNALLILENNQRRENISKELVKDIYNLNKFSVSQLESFNSNPYDHFIKYGIKPREYSLFDINPLDVGNFMHDFLKESIYNEFKKNEYDFDDLFENVLMKVFEDYRIEESKNKYFVKQLKDNTKSYLRIIKDQSNINDISNMYFEERYGMYGKFNSIKVLLNNKEIEMEGIIDRVDEYDINNKKYFRIIDYKTGNKFFDISKVYYGIDLQLMLYLNAVVSTFDNSKPLGAFYQKVNSRIPIDILRKISNESNENSSKDLDILQKNIYTDFKFDGLVLNEPNIYNLSDDTSDIDKASNSLAYNFQGRKWKFSDKDNVIDEDIFNYIFKNNEKIIKQTIENIINGDISLNPYMLGDYSPYTYSRYKTISKEKDLEYRYLEKNNWNNIIEKLKEENE